MATAHCVYIVATLHYSQIGELCYEPGYHYVRLIAFMCQLGQEYINTHTHTHIDPLPHPPLWKVTWQQLVLATILM